MSASAVRPEPEWTLSQTICTNSANDGAGPVRFGAGGASGAGARENPKYPLMAGGVNAAVEAAASSPDSCPHTPRHARGRIPTQNPTRTALRNVRGQHTRSVGSVIVLWRQFRLGSSSGK